jgi:hypothetical protein
MKKQIKEFSNIPYYYLLAKKVIKSNINEITPKSLSDGNYLLIQGVPNSSKDELEQISSLNSKKEVLSKYKKEGYIDIIQISRKTYDNLLPHLEIKKRVSVMLKEIESKSPGIVKNDDENIVADIKDFFEKYKDAEVKNIQIIGEHLIIDAELGYKESEGNLAFKRSEAKQKVYELKDKLKSKLEKKYSFTPLSIQGLDVKPSEVRFEILSILSSHTREDVEMYVEKCKKLKTLVETYEKLTRKKINLR